MIIHTCREATAATIENKVFLTFGIPAKFICDNGTQFSSKAFAELCKQYGTELWFTPAYFSQANPSEAQNKVIGTAIRCYIQNDTHKEWDANIEHERPHGHQRIALHNPIRSTIRAITTSQRSNWQW